MNIIFKLRRLQYYMQQKKTDTPKHIPSYPTHLSDTVNTTLTHKNVIQKIVMQNNMMHNNVMQNNMIQKKISTKYFDTKYCYTK